MSEYHIYMSTNKEITTSKKCKYGYYLGFNLVEKGIKYSA